MNRIYFIAIFCIGILLLLSCKEEVPPIFNSDINFDKVMRLDSKQHEIELSFDVNKEWRSETKYINDYGWCSLTQMSGGVGKNKIQITITENLKDSDREVIINFIVDGLIKKLRVKQSQKDYISVNPKIKNISGKGEDFTIEVKSNTNYSIEIPISCNWIKSVGKDSLNKTINVNINTLSKNRRGVIYLKGIDSDAIDSLIILQDSVPNYSLRGTANSYVILPNSFGKIKISNKGNDETKTLKVSDKTKYQILWEDIEKYGEKSLINDIAIIDEYLYFQTLNYQGNALVAIENNEEIIWSWHLWVLNDAEEINNFKLTTRLGFMDRNLGAVNKKDPGFHYQWGRKDPFLINHYTVSNIAKSLEETIKNPTKYNASRGYTNNSDVFSWYTDMSTSLWGGEKTIYDPSPYGYIVPCKNSWDTQGNTVGWEENYFTFDTEDAYYPTVAVLGHTAGDVRAWWGAYWSSNAFYYYPRAAYYLLPGKNMHDGLAASMGLYIRGVRYSKEN